MRMIRKFIRWLAEGELLDEYMRGWKAGVNQHKHEPESASHGVLTAAEYWGPEMAYMYEEVE